MNIYMPYFYVIQDTRNGMYYVGSKYGKDANPGNFMVLGGYTTSSKIINLIIEKYGLENFVIRKIKIFETGSDAYNYETKFLKKINAVENKKFYNGHNNTGICDHNKMKYLIAEKYGVEYFFQSEIFKEKRQITNIQKYGVKHPNQSNEIKEKYINTHKERYGVEYSMQSDKIRQKVIETNLIKHGVKEVFQSENFKEKARKTNLEKYGTEHACQASTVKLKRQETRKKLLARNVVKNIRIYQDKYKLKFGINWSMKSDDHLGKLLNELILKYGNLDVNN